MDDTTYRWWPGAFGAALAAAAISGCTTAPAFRPANSSTVLTTPPGSTSRKQADLRSVARPSVAALNQPRSAAPLKVSGNSRSIQNAATIAQQTNGRNAVGNAFDQLNAAEIFAEQTGEIQQASFAE